MHITLTAHRDFLGNVEKTTATRRPDKARAHTVTTNVQRRRTRRYGRTSERDNELTRSAECGRLLDRPGASKLEREGNNVREP